MNKKFNLVKTVCLLTSGVGVFILATNLIKQFRWDTTVGIVLEVKEKKDDSGQFYPLVEFTDRNGKKVITEIKQSSNRFYYEKGEKIPIIYSPNDLNCAEINSIGWVYGFPFIFIVLGIIGLLIPSELWHVS